MFRNKISIIISLLLILVAIGVATRALKRPAPTSLPSSSLLPVTVAPAEQKTLLEKITFVGDLKAANEVTLYSKVSGKLLSYLKKVGDSVALKEKVALVDRDEIGYQYQHFPVEAPFEGIVAKTFLDVGFHVTDKTPIALVIDSKTIIVNVDVGEKYLDKLQLEREAYIRVEAYPEEVFNGKISKIAPLIDLAKRTIPIEISIVNTNNKLLSGMFAKVELIIRRIENALVIPEETVFNEEGSSFVFILQEGRAHKVKVLLGLREVGHVQILEGLQAGAIVIASGHHKLHEGSLVEVKTRNGS